MMTNGYVWPKAKWFVTHALFGLLLFSMSCFANSNTGYIEAGSNAAAVTNGYGNWFGQYVAGSVTTSDVNAWNFQLENDHRFNDSGRLLVVGNTHIFNPDWYTAVNIGGSDNGYFLSKYLVDAAINKKWLTDKQLITTLGVTNYIQRQGYKDKVLYTNATYYFAAPWTAQAGIYFNNSSPGNVTTNSKFLAVTEGTDKQHYVTLRFSFGREGYQVLGQESTISNFPSRDLTLNWRQWIKAGWGVNTTLEHYTNPYYERDGITLGVFKDF